MASEGSSRSRDIQTNVFYTQEWTIDVDYRFVNGLLREALIGNYKEGSTNNGNAIRRVMAEVNFVFNTNFDFKFCYERVRRLRQRYNVFKMFISMSGVSYNSATNTVEYQQEVWDQICKVERLCLAYRVRGEPQYEALCRIFQVEDDLVGYNDLSPIEEISSGVNSLSIQPVVVPRPNTTVHDAEFWSGVAGYVSDEDSY